MTAATKSELRKLSTGVWVDSKFRKLSLDSKMLWLYLLTGPITTRLPGIMPVGRGEIADRLGYSSNQVNDSIKEIHGLGMLRFDFDAPMIWLPNAVKYHSISKKSILGWRSHWIDIPECNLKLDAWSSLEKWVRDFDNARHLLVFYKNIERPQVGSSESLL